MQTNVKKLPKSQVELTIELTSDELNPYLEQATVALTRQVNIPGFRPGKAPREMLIKQIGGEMKIYQDAGDRAIQQTLWDILKEKNLATITSPAIAVVKLAPGNPFIYKATIALLPKVKLGEYKKIKVEKKAVKVEPADIDGTLKGLQKMFGKEKRVTRPVQPGDKVEADIDTYLDKVAIDGGTSKNHPVNLGDGSFVQGFEDNLIGLAEGQTKEFNVKFPKAYHRQQLQNRDVEFKVKVNSVFEIERPNLDDNFAKSVGKFEKFSDLKAQIEKNILQEKTQKERQRWELGVIDALLRGSEFDGIPDALIEPEVHKMLHELEHDVVSQGMKFDEYLASIKKTRDDLEKEFQPQAERRIKTALALREIAKQEKITVSDEEVDKQVEADKQNYKNNSQALKQISQAEYRDYTGNILRNRKVFQLLGGE